MRRPKMTVSVEALGTVNLRQSQAEVYELVRSHPDRTARELEEESRIRGVWRRTSELEDLGLVIAGEPRVCCVSGRRAHTFRVHPNPAAAAYPQKRETAADVRRQLEACKAEVRYLAARLREESAARSVVELRARAWEEAYRASRAIMDGAPVWPAGAKA